jgi:hypothetical protein
MWRSLKTKISKRIDGENGMTLQAGCVYRAPTSSEGSEVFTGYSDDGELFGRSVGVTGLV